METENHDILHDKRKHQGQVLMMIAGYCRRHRMLDINLRSLSPRAVDRIGNEIVDLFVDRVDQHKANTPPGAGAEWGDGAPRVRGRSRG